ncbi:hypothetical protein KPH14_012664 [Odynerus spinipes]|uniref:Integrase zinc-binding domain-containing protein n=1 Tax=Odynerus spinipes TaxID=1348599 RepID=A0AAD9RG78_9HYME|nr:hypothetical protein KPH14_012664 [Odynerus spinipes]
MVAEVPEEAVAVYQDVGDENRILAADDNDTPRILIEMRPGATIEDYGRLLEEARNFIVAHEIKDIALDLSDLQHTFRGNTSRLKEVICTLFGGSDITVHLKVDRVLVPENEEEKMAIMRENHESRSGGHGGEKRTYRRIAGRFYWPNMYTDVVAFVKGCSVCQKNKSSHKPTKMPMVIPDTPERFNDKISMDIVGPLPLTTDENR